MTRITQNYIARTQVAKVLQNREKLNKYSMEVSSGLKVRDPGETRQAGTVSQFNELISRVNGYKSRIASATSALSLQDDVLEKANELMIRAKEVATQAANETNSEVSRLQMAEEVFQLRNQMVNFANSTYQGRYIWGGADDDDPPYDPAAYVEPASGEASVRYVFDAETGTDITRDVQVTDDLAVRVNSPANTVFGSSIESLERLGRALSGLETNPASGTPDGTGTTFTFPADFQRQTQAIADVINQMNTARETQLIPERVNVGARLTRLQTADSLLAMNKKTAEEVLNQLQNADVVESASNLSLAQTAFEASLQVTLRALNLSIVDFI